MGKNLDIFKNTMKVFPYTHNTPAYPESGIVNDDMNQLEIQGRKDHLPANKTSPDMGLSHVPNAMSTPGGSS